MKIVVVGRGIIGVSAAYRLMVHGHSVEIIGKSNDPQMASRAAQGASIIKGCSLAKTPAFRNKLEGHALLKAFVETFYLRHGKLFRSTFGGSLERFESAADRHEKSVRVAHENFRGVFRHSVHSEVSGAGYFVHEGDGWVDVRGYLSAVDGVLADHGAERHEDRAEAIERVGSRWRVRRESGPPLVADGVVIAAGAWTDDLLKQSNLPRTGLRSSIGISAFGSTDFHEAMVVTNGKQSLIRYEKDFWVGALTRKKSGADDHASKVDASIDKVSAEGEFRPLMEAEGISADNSIVELRRGIRSHYSDLRPRISPVHNAPGVMIATGFHKSGIQLSQYAAQEIEKYFSSPTNF